MSRKKTSGETYPRCPECKSRHTIKFGKKTMWVGRKKCYIQTYLCNDCGKRFQEPKVKLR